MEPSRTLQPGAVLHGVCFRIRFP